MSCYIGNYNDDSGGKVTEYGFILDNVKYGFDLYTVPDIFIDLSSKDVKDDVLSLLACGDDGTVYIADGKKLSLYKNKGFLEQQFICAGYNTPAAIRLDNGDFIKTIESQSYQPSGDNYIHYWPILRYCHEDSSIQSQIKCVDVIASTYSADALRFDRIRSAPFLFKYKGDLYFLLVTPYEITISKLIIDDDYKITHTIISAIMCTQLTHMPTKSGYIVPCSIVVDSDSDKIYLYFNVCGVSRDRGSNGIYCYIINNLTLKETSESNYVLIHDHLHGLDVESWNSCNAGFAVYGRDNNILHCAIIGTKSPSSTGYIKNRIHFYDMIKETRNGIECYYIKDINTFRIFEYLYDSHLDTSSSSESGIKNRYLPVMDNTYVYLSNYTTEAVYLGYKRMYKAYPIENMNFFTNFESVEDLPF